MVFSPTLSHVVLVITAGVLFYAALTDLNHFRIRNELILFLVGLFRTRDHDQIICRDRNRVHRLWLSRRPRSGSSPQCFLRSPPVPTAC